LGFDDWSGKPVTFDLGSAKLGSNQGRVILVEGRDIRELGTLLGTDNCPVGGLTN
jgi:hypothetical protein